MKILLISLLIIITSSELLSGLSQQHPVKDYVPNAECAVKVAEAIWLPIYGEKIYNMRPYVAVLKGDSVWVVEGTLPKRTLGGTPYIEIGKKDCKILKVAYGA